MNLSTETRVKEIALSNPGARRVLKDAGVDHCCGGGKSLQDACLHVGVTADEIMDRLRQNTTLSEPGDSEWTNVSLADLTRHLQDRHHRYVRDSIPRVRALLAKIREKHGSKHGEIGEIEKLFGDVAREMTSHMQKEEQILFPYIDALERAADGNGTVEPPFFQTVRNPIHAMMQEHDSADELVRKIRKASDNYLAPSDACTSFQAAYQELRQFEEDLHLHVHLENNILFPRAVELEAAII
jgi:regulator of cell morphogenesis and NO signaling